MEVLHSLVARPVWGRRHSEAMDNFRFDQKHFALLQGLISFFRKVCGKTRNEPRFVIPAEAGIQSFQAVLDSRLRGSDDLEEFFRNLLMNDAGS